MKLINFLFGMRDRVTRKSYLQWGFGLLAFKYLGEALIYFSVSARFLPLQQFLSPLASHRYPEMKSFPDWVVPTLIFWSLPFIWIGVSMSIRRAADAGRSPWWGILFFVPVVNFVLMFVLSILPSSPIQNWGERRERLEKMDLFAPVIWSLLFAVAGTILTWFNANFLKSYTSTLFVLSPLILGIVQSYVTNYRRQHSFAKTVGYTMSTIVLVHLALLIFALEGLICVMMSLPISLIFSAVGAFIGYGFTRYCGQRSMVSPSFLLLALPVMPLVENSFVSKTHEDSVLSVIEINASPEKVWPNVVKFSDLPPNSYWLFQLGVAYPQRARIDGEGVGAIRRCEFSTGAFVEPITVWDEPRHLAFNVLYQPQPMTELSFYDQVDAPHLHGYFRSVRGEFRLVPTDHGTTILQGRTWYEMDIQPGWYWQLYGRWFIHKIHLRVLNHIKNLSEAQVVTAKNLKADMKFSP